MTGKGKGKAPSTTRGIEFNDPLDVIQALCDFNPLTNNTPPSPGSKRQRNLRGDPTTSIKESPPNKIPTGDAALLPLRQLESQDSLGEVRSESSQSPPLTDPPVIIPDPQVAGPSQGVTEKPSDGPHCPGRSKASKKEVRAIREAVLDSEDSESEDEAEGQCHKRAPVEFYSVSEALMKYLTGQARRKPSNFSREMERWLSDKWDHLIRPPKSLEAHHFFRCLPNSTPNSLACALFKTAANNLATSRFRYEMTAARGETALGSLTYSVPYPGLDDGSDARDTVKSLKEVTQSLTVLKESFSSALKILEGDINRQAATSRGFITDTTQSLRAATVVAIKHIEGLGNETKRVSTPIAPLTPGPNPLSSGGSKSQGQPQVPQATPHRKFNRVTKPVKK